MQQTSLTQGPIRGALIRFSIPVIVSMLTTQLYTIADTMIVGHMLDANALAAVSNSSTLLMFFLFISGGMELGSNLLIATNKPIYNREQLSRLTYNLLATDIALALVMMVLGLVSFRHLLVLINTPEEIVSSALLYGILYLLGLPFQMVYDLSRQVLIGYGNSKTPMYYVLATSGLNILLDLLLVSRFGVAGAAVASVLAQIVGCFGMCLWLKQNLLVGRFHLCLIKMQYLKDIGRLAPPNVVQQMSGVIITTTKQALVSSLGVAAIAGFSCAGKLTTFMLIPVFSATSALVTFIAQNTALHQEDRIHQGIRTAKGLLFALATLLAVGTILFRKPLLSLFTTDTAVVAYGAILLGMEPYSWLIQVVRYINEARLRGRQKMALYLLSNVSTIAANLLACVILVPRVGFAGFYLSSFISSGYSLVCSCMLVKLSKS